MGKIEWAVWANEQALVSSVAALLGGILAVAGQFKYWQLGVYVIIISILVAMLEYPRAKRRNGHTLERKYQLCFAAIVKQGRLLTRNYFVRFIFYLVISVACCFHLSTLLGGVCFMITSLIYMLAAIKGEEWIPVEAAEEVSGPTVIPEPRKPPPRQPPASRNNQI